MSATLPLDGACFDILGRLRFCSAKAKLCIWHIGNRGATLSLIQYNVKKALGLMFKQIPFFRGDVAHGLTVFAFHEVTDHPSPFADQYGLAVSVATFRRLAIWIKQNYIVIHPRDLLGGGGFPRVRRSFRLTMAFWELFSGDCPSWKNWNFLQLFF